MKSLERAQRVLEDIRKGPVVNLSPARSEAIVAEALREARAHGAGLVIRALETIANLDESVMQKFKLVVLDMLAMDEQMSSEPAGEKKAGETACRCKHCGGNGNCDVCRHSSTTHVELQR